MNKNYDDIINLPHHVSNKHPQMSREARAAQFAPFAALTGYGEAVKETARITQQKKKVDEDEKIILDRKLQQIRKNIKERPEVTVTYFVEDTKKQGGKYVSVKGRVKQIDEYKKCIILENNAEILIKQISEIFLQTT